MFPIFYYQERPKKSNFKTLRDFFHASRLYYVNYLFFNFIGDLIDLTISRYLVRKFCFPRAIGDHFGNWMYLFLYHHFFNKNKKVICFGKKGTVDEYWLKLFSDTNLIIIYNPLLRILFGGFFFSSKLAIDLNGNTPYQFKLNKKKYKNYSSIHPLDDDFFKKNKFIPNKILENLQNFKIFDKPLILFYARSGDWKYSRKNSKRNMSTFNKNRILKYLSKKNNIYLLGDTKYDLELKSKNIFTNKYLIEHNISLDFLYSASDCVIGSFSGSSHYPSMMHSLPTLYIGEGGAPDLLSSLYFFPDKLPKKDIFFLINDKELQKIRTNYLETILQEFIDTKIINYIKDCSRYDVFAYGIGNTELKEDSSGNIHLNSKFKKYKKGES